MKKMIYSLTNKIKYALGYPVEYYKSVTDIIVPERIIASVVNVTFIHGSAKIIKEVAHDHNALYFSMPELDYVNNEDIDYDYMTVHFENSKHRSDFMEALRKRIINVSYELGSISSDPVTRQRHDLWLKQRGRDNVRVRRGD